MSVSVLLSVVAGGTGGADGGGGGRGCGEDLRSSIHAERSKVFPNRGAHRERGKSLPNKAVIQATKHRTRIQVADTADEGTCTCLPRGVVLRC